MSEETKQEEITQEGPKFIIGKRKVRIVGCADSKSLCPMNEPDWEYCGVNNLFLSMPPHKYKWDRWYEIHNITLDNNKIFRRRGSKQFRGQPVVNYLQDLAKLPCPVIMQKKWDIVPNSEPLPGQDIINTLGNYLTNTISWQTAHYIYEHLQGLKEQNPDKMLQRIEIWGVDMAVSQPLLGNIEHNEYAIQKPSCEYWLGVDAGMGIQIFIPAEADLLKLRYLYGYEEPKEHAWLKKQRLQVQTLENRKATCEQRKQAEHDKLMQYQGAIAAIKENFRIWDSGDMSHSEELI